jgi:hypothetical protein
MCLPVTGKPPKPHCSFSALASATVVFGLITIGSVMKPFSNLLTFLIISLCSSTLQLWCTTPTPPSKAICIAMFDSVTVSIGDDVKGVLRVIFLVILEVRSTTDAGKPMWPGRSRKSL